MDAFLINCLVSILPMLSGLGYILDKKHVDSAMYSIYKNNFRERFSDFSNVQRVFALNGEAGLLLCSWPKGNRPALPFVYSDEVWTGIEYQVAAGLIYSGLIDEGLKVVQAVRDRYAGFNRNPWDEIECGHHYARAMASWAVMLSLSGYHYDGVKNILNLLLKSIRTISALSGLAVQPRGNFSIKGNKVELTVAYGTLNINTLKLPSDYKFSRINKSNKSNAKVQSQNELTDITFDNGLTLKSGETLRIEFE